MSRQQKNLQAYVPYNCSSTWWSHNHCQIPWT